MKKQSTRKKQYEVRRRATSAGKDQSDLPRPEQILQRIPAITLWSLLIIGWLVASGEFLAGALGVSWDWTPRISINPQINHLLSNPFGTEFLVENTGRVAVYDMKFQCDFYIDANKKFLTISETSPGLENIATLKPGNQVTRNCGTYLVEADTTKTVDFYVSYTWTLNHTPTVETRRYHIRKGEAGEFYFIADVYIEP